MLKKYSLYIFFSGYTAKSYYSHTGGGVDYQCLPNDPEDPPGATGGHQQNSLMYGTEYKTETSLVNMLWSIVCSRCYIKYVS